MNHKRKTPTAFTLIELVVAVAVVALLTACFLPAMAYTRPKAQRLTCSNNLKQVGLAFRTWAAANGGNMPMWVPRTQGGAAEDVGMRILASSQVNSRGVAKMFLCASNELSEAQVLFCPAECESNYRQAATTFAGTIVPPAKGVPYTNDLNVSYFIGVDASELKPQMLLAGDHNLGGNGNPPTTAFLSAPASGNPCLSLGTNFAANQGPAWLDNMHAKQGNVCMADGGVEWFSRSNLQNALKSSGDQYHMPGVFVLATGSMSGAGCNRIQLP